VPLNTLVIAASADGAIARHAHNAPTAAAQRSPKLALPGLEVMFPSALPDGLDEDVA
jgi:hypothetical protein